MKRSIALIASVALLIVAMSGSAEALVKSEDGADYESQSGTCEFFPVFPFNNDLHVACDPLYYDDHRFDYRLSLPPDARRLRVDVSYYCGSGGLFEVTWQRPTRRSVRVSVFLDTVDPKSMFTCWIESVQVRYRR